MTLEPLWGIINLDYSQNKQIQEVRHLSTHKQVPDIRFKGFHEEWELRKLSDIADITMGQSPNGANYTDNPNDHILVQGNADMKNGVVVPRVWTTQITKTANAGDLILSVRAPVGDVGRTDYDIVIGRGVSAIKGNDFVYQTLLKLKSDGYWKSLSTGSTFESINSTDIKNASIITPTLPEQEQIGTFFKTLDKLITLQQRKLDLLKTQKQGYLQKMFPKPGMAVPELRFKGFDEEWEVKKLGDIGSVAMNKRIFKEQTTECGDVPFFKIGTFGREPDAYISRNLFEEYKLKYPYPEIGDVLISASGSIGRTVVYTGKDEYFQDSNIVWLKHDDQLDNQFLNQFYSIVKWHGLEGSTIKRLYNKNILDTDISLPSLEEQSKIGAFFKQLDNNISLQQQKLDLLKTQKQGFLQKMFP
ncbi:putative type I site-specific deoxyribonuclease [Lactococcus garvieae]|uniref:Putative type I site-specific deoxyribonuclease n=1 Tax=Lactococcus garvieae TaxID=1363 RepID=A0A6L2ZVU5_9LACT|nr:putative type I site-specific deoxyribonuclease [Lactococcus garvieae]